MTAETVRGRAETVASAIGRGHVCWLKQKWWPCPSRPRSRSWRWVCSNGAAEKSLLFPADSWRPGPSHFPHPDNGEPERCPFFLTRTGSICAARRPTGKTCLATVMCYRTVFEKEKLWCCSLRVCAVLDARGWEGDGDSVVQLTMGLRLHDESPSKRHRFAHTSLAPLTAMAKHGWSVLWQQLDADVGLASLKDIQELSEVRF